MFGRGGNAFSRTGACRRGRRGRPRRPAGEPL